ncbi:hypothetical protein GCM10009769_18910 [Curtobacterium luteum]|uniref:Uncharacterized protein n=1 Tax=Curtobacterium luteum TaxID=33881 RepID=A0A8H9G9C7_9MICO|nr:hypothetical protein GCM10009769_18910 [Curtobacterium luteum]
MVPASPVEVILHPAPLSAVLARPARPVVFVPLSTTTVVVPCCAGVAAVAPEDDPVPAEDEDDEDEDGDEDGRPDAEAVGDDVVVVPDVLSKESPPVASPSASTPIPTRTPVASAAHAKTIQPRPRRWGPRCAPTRGPSVTSSNRSRGNLSVIGPLRGVLVRLRGARSCAPPAP